ncbi:MAG: hypothetical protein NTY20_04725 [Candidatus Aenigmarchaeota archaeon]|nr:hypothetical protein [Candidatus Aenigmarchaeota archaeon]
MSSGITGNAAGTYAIEIVAYSDSLEVQNASVTRVLYVSKNLGNLSVPEVKVIPSIINKSSSATLSATVNCAGYCGSVNVNLKVGGVLLNSMTFLSTTDQNPQSCASFPCYLSWNLTGNSVGPFDITVNATSNESLYAINYTNLQVIDPDNPSLGIFSNLGLIMKSAPNQAVPITANVKCFTKDCGQTTVTLSYNNGAGWIDIGSSGIVHSQSQNPVALGNMKVGDSNDLSWGIAFLTEAVYQLRITANGTALNLKNGESTGTINVSQGVLFIDIRNPVEGQSFSLGDVIPLKAMITSGGLPVSTLSPIVTSELFGYAGIYYFPNDGTYTGNASVPSKKVGNYQLVFMAEDSQSNVNIYINPELSVTLKTDKYSYAWDDKIEISGDVKKNGKGAPADITINLASGKWNDVIKLRMGTGSYSHVYENRMPKEGGRLMLEVIAKDDYGNIGNQSAEVGVSAYTGDSYDLSFDMGRNSYNRGDNMTIFVRVSEMNVPKSGLRVNCTLLGADIGLLEGENGYYGNYAIPPNAELGNNSLSCSVAGPKPGQGYETITVEPMPLKITIIDPEPSRYRDTDIISAAPEEPIKLKVSVHYPDGKPVTDATVEIMLGGDKTNMTQTEPGNYIADVRFTKLGGGIAMSTIFLTAQDSQGNQGKSNVGLVVGTGDFNWWWLLLIPAGLAILFVIYIYMKSKEEAPPPQIQIQEKIIKLPTVERVREIIYRPVRMPAPAKPRVDPVMKLKDEIDRLEEKSRTTQDAKDLAEQQYYKRQIDESTFNKLMQSYEEKLIEIDAGIRQKKKELYEIEPE